MDIVGCLYAKGKDVREKFYGQCLEVVVVQDGWDVNDKFGAS